MAAPPWRTGTVGTMQRPAYNAVSVKRTLIKPNTYHNTTPVTTIHAQTNPPTTQSAKRTQFPDSLKAYVARTFENCPSHKKPEVEVALKKIITDAFERNAVWETDWDNTPLPQAKMERDSPQPMDTDDPSTPTTISKFTSIKIGSDDGKGTKRKLYDTMTYPPSSSVLTGSHRNPWDKKAQQDNKGNGRSDKKVKMDVYAVEGPDALDKLNARFERYKVHNTPSPVHSSQPSFTDSGVVIGRSTKLEKRYLRLTSAPDPETVRPLSILRQTLDLLKSKWKAENNYNYICDQFKSLRQDLTVQHIKNDFTINVYEIHARIALEKGDLGEYNQCQTQLHSLYHDIQGGHPLEFKAYRILYLLHTCNRSEMNDVLANLTAQEKKDHAILHALAVRSAVASGNYHRFFRLLLEAPNMGGYLMDSFVPRERIAALCTICKSYRPEIPLRHLTEELGFENDLECQTFLEDKQLGAFLQQKSDGTCKLQTQQSLPTLEAAKKAAFQRVDIKGQI